MLYIKTRRQSAPLAPSLSLVQTYRQNTGAMSQIIAGAPNRLAVVVMLSSSSAIPVCALQGAVQNNALSGVATHNYGTAVSLVPLPSSGNVTLTTSNTDVGFACAYVFDTTGITTVRAGVPLTPYAPIATSITVPQISSTGTALNLIIDRDPSATITSSDSTVLDNYAFMYFKLAAAEKRGDGGTIPTASYSGLVGSYGGIYGSILFE